MPEIAIVRGFEGLRNFDINFYKNFKNLEVTFICPKEKKTPLTQNFIGLKATPAFYVDPVSLLTGKSHLLSWLYLNNLEDVLRSTDIINTIETYFFISSQCASLSTKLHKPLVISVSQNITNHFSKFIPPYSSITRLVCDNASLFIAISEKSKSYLLSMGIEDNKVKVVQPGIDVDLFNYGSTENQVPRILFVGNLTEYKGIPDLLEACRLLWETGLKFELWICGRGQLESLVLNYARKFPIRYFGFVRYEFLPKIYGECDIFCLPSKERTLLGITYIAEQFGFVFLEAMSCGLPVITTDCGAIGEVVGEKNIIIKQSSAPLLSEALMVLITDSKKRKKLGLANRERAITMFDIKKQATILESLLMRLL